MSESTAMPEVMERIAENLAAVRERMGEAALRSGRSVDQIQLVAVTKYVSADIARCIVKAGCPDLGESRPQQLWEKVDQMRDLPVVWHLIGHLQRNKVNRTLPEVSLLHSLDSIRLGQAVDHWAEQHGRSVPALIEVNVSGDATKHGFAPMEMADAVAAAAKWRRVELRGLMCMASRTGGLDAARRDFSLLRRLRDELVANHPDRPDLPELSMGMSADFVVAIEEGATIIRVGSALYEGVLP